MKTTWMSAVVLGVLAASCGAVQDVQDRSEKGSVALPRTSVENDDEVEIALSQVPESIKNAALAAVPGFELVSAEMETEEGTLHYCLEGSADGETVEVEVRASDGKVLEIERGDDDDGDDDDTDDDEDDDEDED